MMKEENYSSIVSRDLQPTAYVVTALDARERGPRISVTKAVGPLQAALTTAMKSMPMPANPYSIEVDEQKAGTFMVSIRWTLDGAMLHQRFSVVRATRDL
jgi:hypothetical protein